MYVSYMRENVLEEPSALLEEKKVYKKNNNKKKQHKIPYFLIHKYLLGSAQSIGNKVYICTVGKRNQGVATDTWGQYFCVLEHLDHQTCKDSIESE